MSTVSDLPVPISEQLHYYSIKKIKKELTLLSPVAGVRSSSALVLIWCKKTGRLGNRMKN